MSANDSVANVVSKIVGCDVKGLWLRAELEVYAWLPDIKICTKSYDHH